MAILDGEERAQVDRKRWASRAGPNPPVRQSLVDALTAWASSPKRRKATSAPGSPRRLRGEVIGSADLPPEQAAAATTTEPTGRYLGLPLREALARLERDLLSAALRHAERDRTAEAKFLGIPRPQLHAKLEEHGLSEKRSSPQSFK
jgi:DNA-binding NtrC family response regulator